MTTGLLLSGGMDSVAITYWKKPDVAFTVEYGQLSAEGEIRAAQKVSELLGIRHVLIRNDCAALGSGDLAGTSPNTFAPASDWWPYRNQLLLTLVAMKAISLGVTDLMIGTVKSDTTHIDGRPEFVEAIDRLLAIQEGGLRVTAPAIALSSAELIRTSQIPIELLAWAHSCHRAEFACGDCRGCNKHRETIQELGYEPY
jgi:7-cyano-7-deazaguanine synthase